MKQIWISPILKRVNVPDKVHLILGIYKVFFPPETTVKLGKNKILTISEIDPWPPPEQEKLLHMTPDKPVRKTDQN